MTENGFGKRSSAYEYRVTNRGGQGIWNIDPSDRNGDVVASFRVESDSQLVMVTDGGTLIRIPVEGIRIAGRKTQVVRLLTTAEDEHVVSVTGMIDDDEAAEDAAESSLADGEAVTPEGAEDAVQQQEEPGDG